MDVLEEGDRVVFLHRIVPGSAGRSYGIHVARLAGVPRLVTRRAEEVLAALEAQRTGQHQGKHDGQHQGQARPAAGDHGGSGQIANGVPAVPSRRGARGALSPGGATVTTLQLTLFGPATPHPVVEALKTLDVMSMTPLEALNQLAQLAERARHAPDD